MQGGVMKKLVSVTAARQRLPVLRCLQNLVIPLDSRQGWGPGQTMPARLGGILGFLGTLGLIS
jgi:hypothetical protein